MFIDKVTINKTANNYRANLDVKSGLRLSYISKKETKYKLCKIKLSNIFFSEDSSSDIKEEK